MKLDVRYSYALAIFAATLGFGAIVWLILGEAFTSLIGYGRDFTSTQQASTGFDRVETAWQFAPVFVLFSAALWALKRAIAEQRRGL